MEHGLGCKRDENVNFLRIYGILGEPGGRGGVVTPTLRIKLPPACAFSVQWACAFSVQWGVV